MSSRIKKAHKQNPIGAENDNHSAIILRINEGKMTMDKKIKIPLPIKSILVVIVTQIIIYLLNLIQINCEFSSTDYNKLISWLIVIIPTIVVALFFKVKLRCFVFVPLTWIILMFFFFVPGVYLSIHVPYYADVAFALLNSEYKRTIALVDISLLELLIAAIIAGCRKLVLYLRNKPTNQIEEKQE